METDTLPHPALPRRQALALLAGAAGLGACALLPGPVQAATARVATRVKGDTRAPADAPVYLAAAWEVQGRYFIGLLVATASIVSSTPSKHSQNSPGLKVHAALEVPSRAHGVFPLADGSIVAVARRPGDWLVRWCPAQAQATALWHWQSADSHFPDRTFNGHVLAGLPGMVGKDGECLYTTETDVETGASVVGVRHARTLQKLAEWPTHGIDAHELIWDLHSPGGPTLLVANGGVPTAPETGRAKRDMHRMDSSLVRLNATTGRLMGQWRLPDPRLSLRHLAWSLDGKTLGIALQAEHDAPADRLAAPVHARFDGQTLYASAALHASQAHTALSLQGYGGSIVTAPDGWAVSCPRAGCVAWFDLQGQLTARMALSEVCALASTVDAQGGSTVWAAGQDHSLLQSAEPQTAQPLHLAHAGALQPARMDNHWVLAQTSR
ncbi:DUF1513 domain-containing protein [Acidovorax sp. DW039]|uniref:DUF1513 domain-containing protein n=1 Tax=Acidovorax sp. DW039 TaxID=3095606 RepID=UPI00308BABA1|nr:DUF1513 domain-containing protein [Acidovorax sp. DW039]